MEYFCSANLSNIHIEDEYEICFFYLQESVGGTTYFYHPDDFKPQNEGPQLVNSCLFKFPLIHCEGF